MRIILCAGSVIQRISNKKHIQTVLFQQNVSHIELICLSDEVEIVWQNTLGI